MDTAAEIAALKHEVARLKRQLKDLHSFLKVEDSDTDPKHKTLFIRCHGIIVCHPEEPSRLQASLFGGDEGPAVSLFGNNDKARVLISVQEDVGQIELFDRDLNPCVSITAPENRGRVAVMDAGKPRAQMKSSEINGGVVSVVHDDGHARATMVSSETAGEIFVVDADMKAAIRMSTEGPEGRGFITVNHASGRPGVILTTCPKTGVVILKNSRSKFTATLPPPSPG